MCGIVNKSWRVIGGPLPDKGSDLPLLRRNYVIDRRDSRHIVKAIINIPILQMMKTALWSEAMDREEDRW